ncbi:uncharacterized protein LOC108933011 [Scleropages formosus]|uniref:uncharacterized protein LOC108933011 n=1 Tax=Scleropages formosus TaxID=113540 RepID=UPI0010FA9087|nr:uncharacterized protein LOC108933011 [Scleropages formosus]
MKESPKKAWPYLGLGGSITDVPTVSLSALPQASHSSPLTLACDIEGFYPEEISVTWIQNGSVLPNLPSVQSGPGGSFRTRHFHTLSLEEKMRGDEVQCVVWQPTVPGLISATMNLSVTGPWAHGPALTKSAKASVALMIISLVLVLLLCLGFSWSKRDEKEKSLRVSPIILPPRVIVGKKGRVTVSIEGRKVDKVQTVWFLNDTPISNSSLTVTEKSPLVPPSGNAGYYKLHKQRLLSSGSGSTQQLLSSFTFIPDISLHKGAVFKCQISYRGKEKVVAERVSDKFTLLAVPHVSEIQLSEPADDTGLVTLTAQASRFHPAVITFRWFCEGGELTPIAPRPSLFTPRPCAQGFFSAISQCKLPWAELVRGETRVWVTVHHMALKTPILRETRGFVKKPCVSEISSLSPEEPMSLGCEITGFYPPEISVTWWILSDGNREEEIVEERELWGPLLTHPSTYRATAILRTGSSKEGVEEKDNWIMCRVTHCSLKEPTEKRWRNRLIGDYSLSVIKQKMHFLEPLTHHRQ